MTPSEGSSRIRSIFQMSGSTTRASIVVPFIIISLALAVLAYRSYQLSVRMERGLTTLAVQYLGYAAEITASRADAAVREQMQNAQEDWRQVERSAGVMDYTALQQWTLRHPWVVTAIYIPDDEPENAVYVQEADTEPGDHITQELYTATGSIRFTYDPQRLVEVIRTVVTRTPEIHAPYLPEAGELRAQSSLALVRRSESVGVAREGRGMSVTFPLAAPMDRYAIRAAVQSSYVGSGWSNHRILSLWFAAVAFILVTVGMGFAIRGIKQEADATQLRAALIANVSHELRTPLAMIRLAGETLKRGGNKLTAKDRNDLEESILREVLHLSHLVENVLDVARLQKGPKKMFVAAVDPGELVRSLLMQYEGWFRSKGFSIELTVDDDVPEQMWEKESISRAVLNLVDNAIKYSSDERVVFVALRELDEAIEISVRDRGIGIHPHELTRIFDPYYRASFSDTESRRGAGLGLTLVQQIVSSHGGKIEVDSTPGEGSTFRMLFPKAPAHVDNDDAIGVSDELEQREA
jgi:signal transduction histidine kinase